MPDQGRSLSGIEAAALYGRLQRERREDPMVPVPRAPLRDACTSLYQHGEDMLREQLERYAYPDDVTAPARTVAPCWPNTVEVPGVTLEMDVLRRPGGNSRS